MGCTDSGGASDVRLLGRIQWHYLASRVASRNDRLWQRAILPVVIVVVVVVGGSLVARCLGYQLGGIVVVRCRQGFDDT